MDRGKLVFVLLLSSLLFFCLYLRVQLEAEVLKTKEQLVQLQRQVSSVAPSHQSSEEVYSRLEQERVHDYNSNNFLSYRDEKCSNYILQNAPKELLLSASLPILHPIPSRLNLVSLLDAFKLVIGAEVGVFRGAFSTHLLTHSNLEKLYLIDLWESVDVYRREGEHQDSDFEKAKFAVNIFKGRYEFVKNYSVLAAQQFADGFFDFVYLDATHTYEEVKKDLQAWYPKLKVGGLMAGHDYINSLAAYFFTVKDAVDEFAQLNNLRVYYSLKESGDPSWYFFKC